MKLKILKKEIKTGGLHIRYKVNNEVRATSMGLKYDRNQKWKKELKKRVAKEIAKFRKIKEQSDDYNMSVNKIEDKKVKGTEIDLEKEIKKQKKKLGPSKGKKLK